MPHKRFAEMDIERREAILAAAAAEFAERGYEAGSVNRIIAHAGISKGILYYYFEDKADLFATVVEQATTHLLQDAGLPAPEDLSADNFWNGLRDLMRRSVELLDSDRWYVQLARAAPRFRQEGASREAIRAVADRGRNQFSQLVVRGQELEVVRRDLPLPLLVDAAMAVDEAGERWLLEHWDELSPEERGDLTDAAMDLIRDMLHAKNEGWEE